MGESSGRKKSKIKIPGISLPHGCMGGLFHILDVNQRMHIRKMLTYNKKSIAKAKSPKVKLDVLTHERHQSTDKDAVEANVMVEDKSRISINSSHKAPAKSIKSKRRHSEQDLSRNLSQLAAQPLRRTVSIHHHLTGNDYTGNAAHSIKKSPIVHNLHESSCSINMEQIPLQSEVSETLIDKHSLLREKLHNAKEMSKKKDSDDNELGQDVAFHQSKEFMEIMVLLNNNRDLLLKVLQNPSTFVTFLESQQNYCEGLPTHAKPDVNDERAVDIGSIAGDKTSFRRSSYSEQKSPRENHWSKRNASARFKVIKKKIKDIVKENKKEGLRISMDGILDKIPYGSKLFKDVKKEKKGVLERTVTATYHKENSRSKSMKRSHSLNESLDKYSQLFETVSESKRIPEKRKIKQEDSRPLKTLRRIFSLPDVQHATFDTVQSFKKSMATDTNDIYAHTMKSPEAKNRQIVSKEQVKCDAFDGSKSSRTQYGTYSFLQEEDPSNWLTKTSTISELDLYFPELSLDSSISDKSQLDINGSIIEDFERLQAYHSEVDDYSSFFSVPVDRHNEAWFSYVRDMLWKSGFGCNEFLRAWYSHSQPVDPSLFEESERVSDPEEFLEYQLLFDLINEVLLQIYDTSSSSYPWLSRFDTRTRPLPVGYHVLEEVWANISWYLDSQPQLDPMLDHAVACDLEKKDGWMDLQYDCEDVGLELEDIILDELLDDVVLDLRNFSGSRGVLR